MEEVDATPNVNLPISETEFDDLVDCDETLECYGELTDREIVAEIKDEFVDNEEEEDVVFDNAITIENEPPNRLQALKALSTLRAYMESKGADLNRVESIEDQINDMSGTFVQKQISDYFRH
jgi:hypothetical protein